MPISDPIQRPQRRKTQCRACGIASVVTLLWLACLLLYKPAVKAATAGNAGDGYVGSQACADCHQQIYDEYRQTSMGRSLSAVTPALLQSLHLPSSYEDASRNRHFTVYAQNGVLYQSEFETDASGKDVFRDTHALTWRIGAGENGFGMLASRDGYLFQAPLSFYAKTQSWSYSPGYEFADYGFSRPILTGCITCHSGFPRPIASTNGRYEEPPFSEAAIGCEKCHGPGQRHIHAMEMQMSQGTVENFIVNPAHLNSARANDLCMSCHQGGDVRVLQPGKQYSDFRPGMSLGEVMAIFKVPPARESPSDEDHVEHYYAMTLSRCYRASAGRLRCITCHDPHVEPSQAQAPQYFNQKCLTCHTSHSCRLPLETRLRSTPADNCIGCHMPKRDIQAIAHSSATNHRIVRTPGEPFPDVAFQQTSASLPDLIDLDPLPGGESSPPLLTLLQAYGELAVSRPEYVAPYLKVLDQLSQHQPENALVQAALGRKALKSGDMVQAEKYLRHSLELDPAQPAVAGDRAEALEKLGREQEASDLLRDAVEADPFNPVLRKKLIVSYVGLRRYADAKVALEEYLQIFPQDSFMREMLARVGGQ